MTEAPPLPTLPLNAARSTDSPRRPANKPRFIGRAVWVLGLLGCLSSSAGAEELAPELLTLDQCIALAHAHNPSLTLEQARLYETEAEYQVARAGLLPKVSVSAYYNQLDPDRLSPVGIGLPGVTLFTGEAFANLRVRQLVFDGSTRQTRTATKLGVDAQRSGVAAAQNETAYAVALAYTRLVAAGSLVKVADEGLKRQAAFTTLTEGFFRVGKIPRLDLLKAQSQQMDAARALLVAHENEALAQAMLRRVMGVAADRPIITLDQQVDIAVPPSEAEVLAQATNHNPAFARLATQARQADAATDAAWGAYLPELSVQASYGLRYRNTDDAADEYTIGAFLEVPIFSGGAIAGQVKRRKAQQRQVDAARIAFADQLRVDVREALTSWRIASATADFATKALDVNREALIAATALYEAGKATALDVLTSQSDLVRAESLLVQAFGDYAIARAKVARVVGTPIEPLK